MRDNVFYTEKAEKVAENAMKAIKMGKVRNHKLKNSAFEHSGEMEKKEAADFSSFLPTKNCDFVLNLRGCDNHAEY